MGYSLTNARNGKSTSRIPKWPNLRPPSLKDEILRQSEVLKESGNWYGKFQYKTSKFSKNSNCCINSLFHYRELKLGHLHILDVLPPPLAFSNL